MKFLIFLTLAFFSHPCWALSGSTIGCRVNSGELKKISMRGQVILNQSFLPTDNNKREQEYKQAIELQIQHLTGYFRTTKSNGLNVAVSAYRGPIQIQQVEPLAYGADFEIDEFLAPTRTMNVGPISSYAQKAMQFGKVKKEDPAIRLHFQTDLIIADCSTGNWNQLNPILLPNDPYLSYWVEGKSHRRPRQFHNQDGLHISNCQSDELINFGNVNQNWFFWSPIEPKNDLEAKAKTCQLTEGHQVYRPQLQVLQSLPAVSPIGKEFFNPSKPIQFYGIFGILSQDSFFEPVDMPKLRTWISDKVQKCLPLKSVPKCLSHWKEPLKPRTTEKPFEPGSIHFVRFLRQLVSIAQLESYQVIETSDPDGEIVLKFQGQLRDSGKAVEIHTFFGTTTLDYGPPGTKGYSKFLYQAFQTGDSISYLGHSGLGTNLLIAQYENLWKRDRFPVIERKKPLWLGIYNCEGFSYFGFDQEKIFRKGQMDLIVTASTGVEADARFPLAQLAILDQILTKSEPVAIWQQLGKYVETKDFYAELRIQD
jgi:hypothetical protein